MAHQPKKIALKRQLFPIGQEKTWQSKANAEDKDLFTSILDRHESRQSCLVLAQITPQVRISLYPHQKEALLWMQKREYSEKSNYSGGILADDMGLGKTLVCISLMIKTFQQDLKNDFHSNLVIAPMSLLVQWKDEILSRTNIPASAVIIYHGEKRKLTPFNPTLSETFVVLTTYDIIRQEFLAQSRKSNTKGQPKGRKRKYNTTALPNNSSILLETKWGRVILDEAHKIRTKQNATTQAVNALQSLRRWCVTGTPFNNKIDDLVTLCKFINVYPYNTDFWWTQHCNDVSTLQNWRETFVMMRTKDILQLPDVQHVTVAVDMDQDERHFYNIIYQDALNQYIKFKNTIGPDRFRLFGSMLSWLIRLRQICNHPLLILGRCTTRSFSTHSMAGKFYPKEICFKCKRDFEEDGWLTELNCGHFLCVNCAPSFNSDKNCKMCKLAKPWLLQKPENHLTIANDKKNAVPCPSNTRSASRRSNRKQNLVQHCKPSSKIKALLNYCQDIIEKDPTAKMVVFSQWTSCIDLVEYFLTQKQFCYLRYDGDIHSVGKRDEVIHAFNTKNQYTILLASLQCGGIGLNLTSANYVFIVDSWYNPFAEEQAEDRVHRIGQKRPVTVIRFKVNNSIENDVVNIQHRKKSAATSVLTGIGLNEQNTNGKKTLAGESVSETDVHMIFRRVGQVFQITKNNTKEEEAEEPLAMDNYKIVKQAGCIPVRVPIDQQKKITGKKRKRSDQVTHESTTKKRRLQSPCK